MANLLDQRSRDFDIIARVQEEVILLRQEEPNETTFNQDFNTDVARVLVNWIYNRRNLLHQMITPEVAFWR